MQDPFKKPKDPMVTIANAAVPILLDRLGGSATVSDIELATLAERYGGAVGVRAITVEPGVYRLSLVSTKPKPKADAPVS